MGSPLSQETINKIGQLKRQGLNGRQIAEELGISRSAVCKRAPKFHVHDREEVLSVNEPERRISMPGRTCNDRLKIFKEGTILAITETIKLHAGNRQGKQTRKGIVIFSNKHYFTIKFNNDKRCYKESFKYSDILCEDIKVRRVA